MSASKKKSSASKKKTKPKVSKTKKGTKVKEAQVEKPKAPAKKSVEAHPKEKAKMQKKEAPTRPTTKPETVVYGPSPSPTVESRHLDAMHERQARGFSLGELSSAGVAVNLARKQGLSIDLRRRSVVQENVEALKGWQKGAAPADKA